MSNSSLTQQNHSLIRTVPDTTDRLCFILITLYSTDLAGSTLDVIVMSHQLFQRRSQSAMIIIIISLLVLHTLLLLGIPFHLSYYVLQEWKFGTFTCKLVSATIYLHMYTIFTFYVAIIIICLFQLEFNKCYTTVWVTGVWMLGVLVVAPVFLSYYGTHGTYPSSQCFQFQQEMEETSMVVANYCLVGVLLAVCSLLTIIQLSVMCRLTMKYWPDINSHVEFRAQAKSFFFTLVTIVCFMPHHVFRVDYI